jgi:hypothetical protein
VRSWRTSRHRLAPSARRTAISAAPPARARQEEIGHVRAADEQHERDGERQHGRRLAQVARQVVAQDLDGDAAVGVRVGVLGGEAARDRVEVGARLGERHAGAQPPVHHQVVAAAAALLLERQRHPQLSGEPGTLNAGGITPTTV